MLGDGRVWVVSELFHPERTSTGHFLSCIAMGLAHSFPVRVLSAQPTYSARGRRAPRRERLNGAEILRCWSTTFPKDVLVLRAINLITITLSMFFEGCRGFRRGDRVLVVTNPPTLPFVIRWACHLRGAQFVLLIHDVYPEALEVAGLFRRRGLAARVLSRLTASLYRSAARIVVLGRDMRDLVAKKVPEVADRLILIPNWADLEEVEPRPRVENHLLEQLGLVDRFVVQYAGNMGRTHDLGLLVEAAELMKAEPVSFLICGWGAKQGWLRQQVYERHLENVTVIDPRPREDLGELLGACDVAVLAFVPGMAGVSVSSRLYNMLAAGRPIIAAVEANSEVALVVVEEGAGLVVRPGDVGAFVAAIRGLAAEPERRREMSEKGPRAAEARYSLNTALEVYTRVLRGLH